MLPIIVVHEESSVLRFLVVLTEDMPEWVISSNAASKKLYLEVK
jgi:hypothetical protein